MVRRVYLAGNLAVRKGDKVQKYSDKDKGRVAYVTSGGEYGDWFAEQLRHNGWVYEGEIEWSGKLEGGVEVLAYGRGMWSVRKYWIGGDCCPYGMRVAGGKYVVEPVTVYHLWGVVPTKADLDAVVRRCAKWGCISYAAVEGMKGAL
jgi:hypothetical protein